MKFYIGLTIVCILFIFVMIWVLRIAQIEEENVRMQRYMDSMKEFYYVLQNRIDATRRYRHDLANHIKTLERLHEKYSDSVQILTYMDVMKEKYQEAKIDNYSKDEILNVICEIKKQQCKEQKIPFEICVSNEFFNPISEIDMVGLLQNLLDNAIEANMRMGEKEKRGIWLSAEQSKEKTILFVENMFSEKETINFQTQKKNQEEHGFGTKIISEIIEKYHGTKEFLIDETQHKFSLRITFSANHKKDSLSTFIFRMESASYDKKSASYDSLKK